MFGREEYKKTDKHREYLKECWIIELGMRRANIPEAKIMKAIAEYFKIKMMGD